MSGRRYNSEYRQSLPPETERAILVAIEDPSTENRNLNDHFDRFPEIFGADEKTKRAVRLWRNRRLVDLKDNPDRYRAILAEAGIAPVANAELLSNMPSKPKRKTPLRKAKKKTSSKSKDSEPPLPYRDADDSYSDFSTDEDDDNDDDSIVVSVKKASKKEKLKERLAVKMADGSRFTADYDFCLNIDEGEANMGLKVTRLKSHTFFAPNGQEKQAGGLEMLFYVYDVVDMRNNQYRLFIVNDGKSLLYRYPKIPNTMMVGYQQHYDDGKGGVRNKESHQSMKASVTRMALGKTRTYHNVLYHLPSGLLATNENFSGHTDNNEVKSGQQYPPVEREGLVTFDATVHFQFGIVGESTDLSIAKEINEVADSVNAMMLKAKTYHSASKQTPAPVFEAASANHAFVAPQPQASHPMPPNQPLPFATMHPPPAQMQPTAFATTQPFAPPQGQQGQQPPAFAPQGPQTQNSFSFGVQPQSSGMQQPFGGASQHIFGQTSTAEAGLQRGQNGPPSTFGSSFGTPMFSFDSVNNRNNPATNDSIRQRRKRRNTQQHTSQTQPQRIQHQHVQQEEQHAARTLHRQEAAVEAERQRLAWEEQQRQQHEAERQRLADQERQKQDAAVAAAAEQQRLAHEEQQRQQQKAAAEAERMRLAHQEQQRQAAAAAVEQQRLAHEEQQRQLQAEAERKRLEKQEHIQNEAQRDEEQRRLEAEKRTAAEAEQQHLGRERAENEAHAAAEAEQRQKRAVEAERLAKQEQERQRQAVEAERLAKQEQERATAEAARHQQEVQQRAAIEAEQQRQQQAVEAERLAKQEQERVAAEAARHQQEAQQRAAIEAEQQRLRQQAHQEEQERLQREAQQRAAIEAEQQRLAEAEKKRLELQEQERLQREAQQRAAIEAEQQRLEAAEAEKKRLERQEQEHLQREAQQQASEQELLERLQREEAAQRQAASELAVAEAERFARLEEELLQRQHSSPEEQDQQDSSSAVEPPVLTFEEEDDDATQQDEATQHAIAHDEAVQRAADVLLRADEYTESCSKTSGAKRRINPIRSDPADKRARKRTKSNLPTVIEEDESTKRPGSLFEGIDVWNEPDNPVEE